MTEVSSNKTAPQKSPSDGAFDCLRLLAATGVLFSHCYPLLGIEQEEPVARVTGGLTLGTLCVYAFFSISGYLVTQSWMRDGSMRRFMSRRSLRIFPALIFVIVASFATIGPLVTTLPIAVYFKDLSAWTYLAKIFIYPSQYGLPGVFDNNPFPKVVNGSLWTLRLEFGLYIVVAILGVLRILRPRFTGIALALLCFMASLALEHARLPPLPRPLLDFFINAVPFFIGMAVAESGISMKKAGFVTAFILAVGLLLRGSVFLPDALLLGIPCLSLYIARFAKCHLGNFGDYSYGLYLWGFPVEQTILHFAGPLSVTALFLRAALVTLAIAIFSWHVIEKSALRLKPRKANNQVTN